MPAAIGAAAKVLGMQAAGNAVNGLTGAIFGGMMDRRQIRQQKKLQALEMQGSKEMTDYNSMKQLEMWEKTGYGAQMNQLEDAGLNPALIYGQGGGGGQTAQIAQGKVSGSDAPKGGGEYIGMASQTPMMVQQMKLLDAQAENIKADTVNKKADTAQKTETTEGLNLDNNIKAIMQSPDTGYAINEGGDIIGTSDNSNLPAVKAAMKQVEEFEREYRNNIIDAGTLNERMSSVVNQALTAEIHNRLIEANIKLTKEQTEAVIQKVMIDWANQDVNQREVAVKEALMEYNTDLLGDKTIKSVVGGIGNVIGGALGQKVKALVEKGKQSTIKTFSSTPKGTSFKSVTKKG